MISAEDFSPLFCTEDLALVRKEFELYLFFYARVLTESMELEFIVFQGRNWNYQYFHVILEIF